MFTLPELPFSSDALEPYIDSQTMLIHHDKHHAAYVKNLNDALSPLPDLASKSESDLVHLLQTQDSLPENIQVKVRNNGGGHWNHSFFWKILSPAINENKPTDSLATAIDHSFGSFDSFKEKFTTTALARFGSGWAWVVKQGDGLQIIDTPNQDTPVMEGKHPILGLDVWEHAYYLKYQNRRAEYIAAFWNVINWKQVSELFLQ